MGVWVMSSIPEWLPDWEGAEDVAKRINGDSLRKAVADLLELVYSDDTVYMDSLPEELESALISPLGFLAEAYEANESIIDVIVAARLVRRSVVGLIDSGPDNLKRLIESFPQGSESN